MYPIPYTTLAWSATPNGRHCALSALAAGHRLLRRALWLLIIYFSPTNERQQTRSERKVWGSCLTSPVITHSQLLSCPQALLSNRTGHGQLWHMPEQRMHYLQVSGHSSSNTWWSKFAMSFVLEGKWTGRKEMIERKERGMDVVVNEYLGHVTYTHSLWIYTVHLTPLLPLHTPSFTEGCL